MSELSKPHDHTPAQHSVTEELLERAPSVGFRQNYNVKYDFEALPSCLTDPIDLEAWPYETGNVISPTPLDPHNVSRQGSPYVYDAFGFMFEKFKKRAAKMGLDDDSIIEAITDEIGNRHLLQCERNEQSFYRLCQAIEDDPSRFTSELDSVIRRVRSGEASSEERIFLLATFPEIESIEDMKFSCAFEEDAYQAEMTKYTRSLVHGQFAPNSIYTLRSVPRGSGPQTRMKDVSDNASENTFVVKGEYAIIESKGVEMGLIERKSHYMLTDEMQLKGMKPRWINGANGKRVNLQTVLGATYLKVENFTR